MPINKITRFISLAALFIIPVFPLIVTTGYFFPFITGKAFFFRFLVEIAFVAWMVLAFLEPKYRPRFSALTVAAGIFVLVTLLADLVGLNPIRSIWSNFERMEGWLVIVHLFAFYLTMSSLFGEADPGRRLWHRWLNVSLAVALVTAIYGLFQLFGWAAIHQGSTRLDASLGNSAYLAVYMLFHVFIAAYMFFRSFRARQGGKTSQSKNYLAAVWIYGILTLLFAFILVETQTRGTILGLVGGIMVTLASYAIFGRGESRKQRWISAGIVGLIVVLGVVFWFNRHAAWIESNPILGRFSNISWNESSNQARQYVWPMAIAGALERPILGLGQENFNYVFNQRYNPLMYSQEQWFDRAHSVFLDWLVAGGFVGLIAYLSLYVLFLMSVWKSDMGIVSKSVLTGLLAGYFVHNIFVFDNLASYAMFFSMLAFADSFGKGPARLRLSKPVREDAVEYIVAPIAVVAFIVAVYFFNVRPIQANTRLIAALRSCSGPTPDVTLFESALSVNAYVANQEIREQLLSCAAGVVSNNQLPGPTRQAFFSLANNEILKQASSTPNDARIYTLGGSFLNTVGQYAESATLLEKAHKLSPRKQTINFELANSYLNAGRTNDAIEVLKEAYEAEPQFSQAKLFYAVSLVAGGKEAEAKKLFGNDPSVFKTPQMAQAYVMNKQYSKAESIYLDLSQESPKNPDIRLGLAQIQYMAGMKYKAVATLQALSKDFPELKTRIDEYIKQIQ